jgi:hypothetical protein
MILPSRPIYGRAADRAVAGENARRGEAQSAVFESVVEHQFHLPAALQYMGEDPLAPGKYSVIEYTEGKMNMQVSDFAIKLAR